MGKHYVMFTIEDSKTLKHRKDLMGKRKEVQDLYSGLNLFKELAVSPCITSYISSSQKKVAVIKPEQIHRMTIIFPQNDEKLSF